MAETGTHTHSDTLVCHYVVSLFGLLLVRNFKTVIYFNHAQKGYH